LLFAGIIATGIFIWLFTHPQTDTQFDGIRAYDDIKHQLAFGPRTSGSPAQEQFLLWLRDNLKRSGWDTNIQQAEMMGHPIKNLIAKRGELPPKIILLAHYDSRLTADNDPDLKKQSQPVPGANDGASGVAVLLELARILPPSTVPVWLVFLDAEDNGRIPGWDWILGAKAFVPSLVSKPQAVVLVDMIGDANLNIYMEKNSDKELTQQIWDVAKSLGYDKYFIPEYKYRVIDDHIPFLDNGIPAVDIIDLDYPYWHTTSDTTDKVSSESLKIVGETLRHWVISQNH
jgi:Zn-dependent M28 family amino/carboxypeptidase